MSTERACQALERNSEVQTAALDASRAFHGFWHASLLRKLKGYGVSGRIFLFDSNFLSKSRN